METLAGCWLPLALGALLAVGLTALHLVHGAHAAVRDSRLEHARIRADQYVGGLQAIYQSPYPQLHTLHTPHAPQIRELPAASAPAPAIAAPLASPIPPPPPTTRQLLAEGRIRPGAPMILGFTLTGPLYGSADQLYTAAIGGRSGSGKTRTVAYLALQAAQNGARILAIDPHAHKPDALAPLLNALGPAMLRPTAGTPAEWDAVLQAGEELLAARRGGAPCWPALLIIDEYTLFQRIGDDRGRRMATLVEGIATEGRGFQLNAIIMGQNWKATRTGGTEVREACSSGIMHRGDERQARYLISDSDLAATAPQLVPGRAIFAPTDDEPQVIGIPFTDLADMYAVGRSLPAPSPASPAPIAASPRCRGEGVDPAEATTPEGAAHAAQKQQIRALILDKTPTSEIIKQLFGVSSGRAYTEASRKYTALLAEILGGK